MKKKIWLYITLAFTFFNSFAQGEVVADISNFKSDKGICRACLFNSQSSFKGESGQPYKCLALPVKNKTVLAKFENVPAGEYALFVFHDVNSNHVMDKNFFGIPKEGYGASKNNLPFAGAPTFNDNKFRVENKTIIKLFIRMRNL